MLQLQVLGALDIRSADGSPVVPLLSHPKAIGFLVYLVLARPRGFHRRETLCSLFWPESDESHARGALSQTLSRLRRAVATELIETRGADEVRVADGSVACDVIAFEEAVEGGDHVTALSLYRGTLVPGLHVREAGGFEDWLEDERTRLRGLAGRSARSLVRQLLAAGRFTDAEATAEQHLQAPIHEAVLRELAAALVGRGDRAGAVRLYEGWSARLRRELELEPSAEFQQYIQELRSGGGALEARAAPAPAHARLAGAAGHHAEGAVTTHGQRDVDRTSTARAGMRRSARRGLLPVLGLLLALTWLGVREAAGPPAAGGSRMVAVLPVIERDTPAGDTLLADGIRAELLVWLGQVRGLRVIPGSTLPGQRDPSLVPDELAALGVTHTLELEFARGGDSVRVKARLFDARAGVPVWGRTYDRELTPQDLVRIKQDIARRVALAVELEPEPPLTGGGAESGTGDLEAYEWYLRGIGVRFGGYVEREMRYRITCLERAVTLDPGYAAAWAALAIAHAELFWSHEETERRAAAARRALGRARGLAPDHPETRLAGAVYDFRVRGDNETALREVERLRSVLASDPRVSYMLAAVYRRSGRWEQALEASRRTLALDPRAPQYLMDLGITLLLMRQYEAAETHLALAVERDPTLLACAALLASARLARHGDAAAAAAGLERTVRAGMLPLDDPLALHVWARLQLLADNPRRALEVLELQTRDFLDQPFAVVPTTLLRAQLYAAAHRPDLARPELLRARHLLEERLAEAPADPRLLAALGLALAELGERDAALRNGERAVRLLPVSADSWRGALCLEDLARIHARAGDIQAAAALVAELLSRPGPLSASHVRLDPVFAAVREHPRVRPLLD